MKDLKDTLRAVEILFPNLKENELHLHTKEIPDLPYWLKAAANIFLLEIRNQEPLELTLIQPKSQLTFDQIQNVYEQVSRKSGPNTLLIADNINSRNRPLLVKFRIPFIYKSETIFAPALGMVFKNLHAFETKEGMRAIPFRKDELHPFSLKLISGYLLGKVEKEFQLKGLNEDLIRRGGSPSVAKLSGILAELVNFEFLRTEATGPKKKFIFGDRKKVWQDLQTTTLGNFMRAVQAFYVPGPEQAYVLAGESGLSQHSDLAEPKIVTKAIALADYNTINKETKELHLADSGEPRFVLQLWKENPKLFSSRAENTINPIELYFSMRDHHDEQIQMALEKMLSKLGLTPLERG
ncbi:hypothetical protein WDW86_22620 [Bdellovibrionota bacterium FG-2]